jgi:hypothetical protein
VYIPFLDILIDRYSFKCNEDDQQEEEEYAINNA